MAQPNFDYEGALNAGYSHEEIDDFLKNSSKSTFQKSSINQDLLKNAPNFDVKGAIDAGYSEDEINEFLSKQKPKKSKLEKAGRIGAQYGLGILQGSPAGLAYEAAAAPMSSPEAQNVAYRQNVMEDIERLTEQKQTGVWDQQDEELLNSLVEQMKNPKESAKFAKTANVSIRGLVEDITGLNLEPEGFLEHAANWTGNIKDPKNIVKLGKLGMKPKEIIKVMSPTGSEVLRGAGAGAALEIAKDGDYGPIGTMAAVIIGDLLGVGIGGAGKAITKFAKAPKETLAKKAAQFVPKEKLALQKELIEDFRKSGLQADLGTLVDNDLTKMMQARISQSGFSGKSLDEFKNQLTNQIKDEYGKISSALGEAKYSTMHEAGLFTKEGLKSIRDADLTATRELYANADKSLKETAFVNSERLANAIQDLEKSLKPGQVKSTEQNVVLNTLEKLKRDFTDTEGRLLQANVKDLMNNKIALNDIINYEVEGGAKQLLKGVVSEIDRAIISHGKENPTFAKNYINANKRFAEHAKTFRNNRIKSLLRDTDPAQIMNKMNSVQGIRDLENILNKTPGGKDIFNKLKRTKLEDVIGNHLVDSTTQQIKLGTFSKLLEKGKNKEVIREILGVSAFKRLERLQRNAGKLADSVNKFYNTSKSGVTAVDSAIIIEGMSTIVNLLHGNPWPLMKIGVGIVGARKLGSLLADPEFLKLTEDAILAAEKQGSQQLIDAFEKLVPYLRPYTSKAIQEEEQKNFNPSF